MNIREFIQDLLQKHQVVVLPGFGGFIAEYEDAKVDPKQNKFEPPSKKIKFDTKLQKDENLILENYLINTFKLSKNEAAEKLTQLIEEVKNDLSSGNEVEFKNVGSLKKNEKNELIFVSKTEKNLLLDSFGFDSFTHQVFDKPKKSPIVMRESPNNNKKKRPVLTPVLGAAVIFILLISALLVFTDVEKTLSNISLFGRKEKTKVEKTGNKNETELAKSLDEQTDPSVALQITEENQALSNDKYANCTEFIIVAGSFTQFKNAEKLRQRLTIKGYEPEIILSKEKRYRVALKSFDNRQIALKEFEILKEKEKDLKIWLLSI